VSADPSRIGTSASDPTRNVIDLVSAAIVRQDDLRESESLHIRELVELRARYDGELREAETARIDAIRAVDVGAVNRAAEVAATQATTLAAAVATSAETLRTQVAATATAGVVGLAAALEPIQKDISELRRYQYEGQGQKQQGIDSRALLAVAVSLVVLALLGVQTFRHQAVPNIAVCVPTAAVPCP